MRRKRYARVMATAGMAAALLCTPVLTTIALAFEPTGACCLADGTCDDILDAMCESEGGTFIGVGTSCGQVACDTSLVAPMLSIFGLVSAVGMLGGFGLYRLLYRPR